MSEELGELPEAVKAWIGQRRYEQVGEFDVERGYVLTSCASVENGNPLYLGREGGDRHHGRLDRAAHDALGLVPARITGRRSAAALRSRCRSTSISSRRSTSPRPS